LTTSLARSDALRAPIRYADTRPSAPAPALKERLVRFAPRIAWFHGEETYRHYLRHAEALRDEPRLGVQDALIGTARVFVTPNPSPANAVFSLDELVEWYRALGRLRDSLASSGVG
jgi:TDG/mug DNA glycosylase family protein